jgi:glycosyltransferase involved in cell wall biosynthesis
VTVTVAIPVLNGGELLRRTLEAVRAQRLDGEVELLVCDSGSSDGSVAVARGYAAHVIQIPPQEFTHGGTRNLLMETAHGEHVAFLSQDSEPADEWWLARMVEGFGLAANVGLAFGPYLPRPSASPMVARELTEWFRSLSPTGEARLDWLSPEEREPSPRALLGARGFFTDANGCISKSAWESVPFRAVAYAEDHLLAHDMLRAGYPKVYLPDAAVIHSHDYSSWDWLRRSFDEARAMRELYDFSEPGDLRHAAATTWGQVGADWRWLKRNCRSGERRELVTLLLHSAGHRLLRGVGAMLGARADQLPEAAVKRLSLEGRGR